MEYKRCIKITDGNSNNFIEYFKSLPNCDITNDSAWGLNSEVTLNHNIKELFFKALDNRCFRYGNGYYALVQSFISFNNITGEVTSISASFGNCDWLGQSSDLIDIAVRDLDTDTPKIITEYSEA